MSYNGVEIARLDVPMLAPQYTLVLPFMADPFSRQHELSKQAGILLL